VLALCFPEPRAFSGEDREFLLALARHCALAMERARLLTEVETQRSKLEELVMRVPAVMSVTRGPEHRFVRCNPRYRQLLGGRDVTGLTVRQAMPELESQGIFGIMDRVYATGEPFVGKEFPMRLGAPSGDVPTAESYFDFVYQPLRDAEGRVEGIASFAFEVTDQVLARRTVEELLRDMARSEERFRALLTSTTEIIWDMPPGGEFSSDQPGWRAFTGQTREQLLGWGWLEAVHPEDREGFARAWRQAVPAGTPFQGEVRLRRHDGVYRHMQVRAVPVLELDGTVREWVGIHRDITRQREDEAERARLMAESQAANRAKDEFLAVMSHELRTPLTAVLGWTQMLRKRQDDAVMREKGLEVIERNARSLAQLIEDVLDVSRILTGKLALNPKVVELAGVVQAAVEVVRPRAEQKGVALTIVGAGAGAGQVAGDPGRLQQVLWNLLVNAVKFTPEGGKVEVWIEPGEGEWRVRVKDTGQGIHAEALPHLFERFWQADGSSTREHGGLGLGLAIVRHLVELHGGKVEVESAGLGQGATFTVRLPVPAVLPELERAVASGEGAARPARLEGVRVLLVEDAEDARELIALLLRERGAEVRSAANGREAMERLAEALPDVLVSDIGLPGEDGHALLKRIREWTEARDEWLPAIALTAYAGAEDARRAYRAGFQVHLAKPLEAEALVESVARLAVRDGSMRARSG
jgi:PAS domain S-box-containing protein